MISKVFIFFITLYQKTLSPDHGFLKTFYPHGYCQYYPSCSQYAKELLETHGLKSLPGVAWRVLRCNPWSSGGLDPINK